MSPDPAGWTAVNGGFNYQDQAFHCSTSGQPARRGEPIFRGSFIDLEGHYSICLDSALQVGKLAGLIDPDELITSTDRVVDLGDKLEKAVKRIEALQMALDGLLALDALTASEEAAIDFPDWVSEALD
jgi:hypothetical protein